MYYSRNGYLLISQDDVRYESISDVRNQLRVFEEIDEVERKHRESREREILIRVAKVTFFISIGFLSGLLYFNLVTLSKKMFSFYVSEGGKLIPKYDLLDLISLLKT